MKSESKAVAPRVRVVIYARQSVKVDEGIKQQLAVCRARAKSEGWEVIEEFADNAVSGSKVRNERTRWAAMLALLDGGGADVVLSVAVDRLTRRLSDVLALRDRGVRIVTVRDGIDSATGMGRTLLAIVVTIAEQDVDTKTARALPYRLRRNSEGIPTAGRVPFGYRWRPESERKSGPESERERRYAIEKQEEGVVRYLFAEAEKTASTVGKGIELGFIAAAMNAKGWRTRPSPRCPDGAPWRPMQLRRMLLSPIYASLLPDLTRARNGSYDAALIDLDECLSGDWEPLAAKTRTKAEDVLRLIRADLTRERRTTNGGKGGTVRKHLLPGIARCGAVLVPAHDGAAEVCGVPVRSGWTREGYRAYKCPEGHFQRRAEVIDEWAVGVVLERLSAPDAARLLRPRPEADVPSLVARQRALEARRTDALSLLSSGRFTSAEVLSAVEPIAAELAIVGRDIAAALDADPLAEMATAEDVAALWDGYSLARRRAVLAGLFVPIVQPVGKGRIVTSANVGQSVAAAWRRNIDDGAGRWAHPLAEDTVATLSA